MDHTFQLFPQPLEDGNLNQFVEDHIDSHHGHANFIDPNDPDLDDESDDEDDEGLSTQQCQILGKGFKIENGKIINTKMRLQSERITEIQIKAITYNVNSIGKTKRRAAMNVMMDMALKTEAVFICIIDHRIKDYKQLPGLDGYYCGPNSWSLAHKKISDLAGGIAIYTKVDIYNEFHSIRQASKDYVVWKSDKLNICIIATYIKPYSPHYVERIREMFWNLRKMLEHLKRSRTIILWQGDMKGNVIRDLQRSTTVTNGAKILSIAKQFNLKFLNLLLDRRLTYFRKKEEYSMVDYAFIGLHMDIAVIEFEVIDPWSMISDHKPIMTTITLRIDRNYRKSIKESFKERYYSPKWTVTKKYIGNEELQWRFANKIKEIDEEYNWSNELIRRGTERALSEMDIQSVADDFWNAVHWLLTEVMIDLEMLRIKFGRKNIEQKVKQKADRRIAGIMRKIEELSIDDDKLQNEEEKESEFVKKIKTEYYRKLEEANEAIVNDTIQECIDQITDETGDGVHMESGIYKMLKVKNGTEQRVIHSDLFGVDVTREAIVTAEVGRYIKKLMSFDSDTWSIERKRERRKTIDETIENELPIDRKPYIDPENKIVTEERVDKMIRGKKNGKSTGF